MTTKITTKITNDTTLFGLDPSVARSVKTPKKKLREAKMTYRTAEKTGICIRGYTD